jgi:hypothetical protein
MGEERIVAEDIHGGSYPVVKKGKEDDSFYHGKLEHGTLIENHGDDRTIFTKAAPFLIASWIVLLVHEFSYLQAAPELSTPLQSISKYVSNCVHGTIE